MGSRQGKKKKKQHAPKVLIGMSDKGPTELPALRNPQDDGGKIPKYSPAVSKPPDSTLAWWWLLTGIMVAAIYAFQLTAMLDSNKINRDALESVQRAFVTFSPQMNLGTRVEGKRIVSFFPQVPTTNNGVTPTKGMLDHINIYVTGAEMPRDFSFPDTGDMTPVPVVLAPKGTLSYGVGPIDVKAVQSVQDHTGHAYLYGWATYRDIFPNTKEHITEFCYELNVDPTIDIGDLRWITDHSYSVGSFNLCTQGHNCTDDECKDRNRN
jgi:hypothetical protein